MKIAFGLFELILLVLFLAKSGSGRDAGRSGTAASPSTLPSAQGFQSPH